jgi:hypothetical protein
MSDMPRFEQDWFFLGFVKETELPELFELAKKYKCDLKHDEKVKAVYSNNPFRIDSIRKRLWGHRWAISSEWLEENPQLAGFDPRKCKKIKKRVDK